MINSVGLIILILNTIGFIKGNRDFVITAKFDTIRFRLWWIEVKRFYDIVQIDIFYTFLS